MRHPALKLSLFALPLLASACNEPTYTNARGALEVNRPMGSGGVDVPTAVAALPLHELRDEEPDDFFPQRKRDNDVLAMERAMTAGVTVEEAPFLLRDDIAIQVDWTLKNLEDMPGTATVTLNGANEFIDYDPGAMMIDPDSEEAVPPALLGGTPFDVGPLEVINGTFREDQLDEAMLDLDLIRRTPDPAPVMGMAAMPICPPCGNPFMAILQRPSVMPADQLVAGLFRVSVSLAASRHMVLDFVVRVRERTDGVVATECSQVGGDGACRQMLMINDFNPTPAMYSVMMTVP